MAESSDSIYFGYESRIAFEVGAEEAGVDVYTYISQVIKVGLFCAGLVLNRSHPSLVTLHLTEESTELIAVLDFQGDKPVSLPSQEAERDMPVLHEDDAKPEGLPITFYEGSLEWLRSITNQLDTTLSGFFGTALTARRMLHAAEASGRYVHIGLEGKRLARVNFANLLELERPECVVFADYSDN